MPDSKIEKMSLKIKEIYAIVKELEDSFPGRHFTPDGHLVGSIGEVLVSHYYNLDLLTASTEKHDATAPDGRYVQIKATQSDMKIALSSEPEHLIAVKILNDGSIKELYNGPGSLVWNETGPRQKNGCRYITVSKLIRLMKGVPLNSRIEMTR